MNIKKVVLVVAGVAASGALITGCSSSSTSASSSAVSESVAAPASGACAKGEAGQPVEIKESDTCAEVPAGQFGLLYSLARDDIKDARIEIVSGDKHVAVPLNAPDSDGGFLMGFVAESEGKADIAVYVTPSDGSAEKKVQELSVTAVKGTTALPLVDGSAAASGKNGSTPASGGEWTDTTVIPS